MKIRDTVISETSKGFFYGQAVNPSISASYNPQIFGMYHFTNPDSRLQAIRHVMKPSVGFNYIPSIPGLSSDMYEHVQIDTTGHKVSGLFHLSKAISTEHLHYQRKAELVSFGLVNIVEGKMFARMIPRESQRR